MNLAKWEVLVNSPSSLKCSNLVTRGSTMTSSGDLPEAVASFLDNTGKTSWRSLWEACKFIGSILLKYSSFNWKEPSSCKPFGGLKIATSSKTSSKNFSSTNLLSKEASIASKALLPS
ncbi:hypothetical protein WICPIJ_004414 [Wickerhamomyces pijperi]|uniref:Uncharacterized protein n=1 Tax=Wickerhamomyces pijperi TaxID=599730 RepID=A0A9P8Q7Q0_WICPI|nr:hypothetical protein WICPIJ_004414 [Wickerhamomyces pijperi]